MNRRWLLAAGVLIGGAAAAWGRALQRRRKSHSVPLPATPQREKTPEGTLFSQATRIGAGVPLAGGDCFWKSDTEILTLRPASDRKRFQAAILDVHTGKEALLEAFNARWGPALAGEEMHVRLEGQRGEEVVYNAPPCHLSPDGRWLLWLSQHRTWIAASLDGKEERKWPVGGFLSTDGAWLHDGRRWAEVHSVLKGQQWVVSEVVIHNVEAPRETRRVAVAGIHSGLVLGATREDRVLLYDPGNRAITGHAELTALELSGATAVAQVLRPKLPSEGTLMEAVLAPAGERVLWVLGKGDTGGLPRDYHLWVIALTGDHASALGWVRAESVVTPGTLSGTQFFWPQSVRWAPDGKRICFTFRGGLYTARVPDVTPE